MLEGLRASSKGPIHLCSNIMVEPFPRLSKIPEDKNVLYGHSSSASFYMAFLLKEAFMKSFDQALVEVISYTRKRFGQKEIVCKHTRRYPNSTK